MDEQEPTPTENESNDAPGEARRVGWALLALEGIASGRLALVLIGLLIVFSILGAILPQEGQVTSGELARWQFDAPTVTRLAEPIGLFHVFRSWSFVIIITVLTLNTLTCTILHLVRQGGFRDLAGMALVRRVGFVVLHLSLLLLFAGGFLSAATDLDGKILLTEGQSFTDAHENFLQVQEGRLRREHHSGATVRLKSVDVQYASERYRVGVTSQLEVLKDGEPVSSGTVRINVPFEHEGLSYTHDQTGFSPRLILREARSGRLMADSFIALETVRKGGEREYRDFLPLPFLDQQVVVTLYPSFVREDGEIRKAGDRLAEPMLVLTTENDTGAVIERQHLAVGGRATIGRFTFEFPELRQWVSFRVGHDPGYPFVCVALWLAVAALVMRYLPDIRLWLRDWSAVPLDQAVDPSAVPQTVEDGMMGPPAPR